jgi:hypothetical protein
MSWENIQVDDYGWVGKLTVKQDGSAVDISSYTTKQFIFESPGGTDTTKAASFDSDGTDGILAYTIEDGLIDEAGTWQVAARISKVGAELTSDPLRFYVAARTD